MPVNAQQRKVVESLFKAMQAGPGGEEAMVALFADDAVLVEPFSGQPQTHRGRGAIRQSFRDQWKNPPPDLTLVVERVDLDGSKIRAEWTCTSPAFPSPMRGYDVLTLNKAGQIMRLEIVVTDAPPMER
jgi:SnoaL-like domain